MEATPVAFFVISGEGPRGDVAGCERARLSRSQRNHAASATSASPTTTPTTPPTIAPTLVELPEEDEEDEEEEEAVAVVDVDVNAEVNNVVAVDVLGDEVVSGARHWSML